MTSRPSLASYRRALGSFGERLAAATLIDLGADVTGRNLRAGRGEIDLLALVDGDRAAIEVKTIVARSADDSPLVHFDRVKAERVRSAALSLDPPVYRVDVIAVTVRPDRVDVHWIPRVA